MRYRFEAWVLDTAARALTRESEPVPLPRKTYDLLVLLVEKWPAPVAHAEIYERLWPGTFVDASSIHTQVHDLREALSDQTRTVIRNVHGFGFRIGVDVVSAAVPIAAARFELVVGERVFGLVEGENVIGRDRDCQVRIDASSVSRHHARIVISEGSAGITDLGSKNGTFVGDRRLRSTVPLQSGARIVFGSVASILRLVPPTPSTATNR